MTIVTLRPTYFLTDVFTSRRYGGNQLATFVDCETLSSDEMLEPISQSPGTARVGL